MAVAPLEFQFEPRSSAEDEDAEEEERPRVDHTYRDYSRYLEDGGPIAWHKKAGANFPALLHQMLSEPQYAHIIAWQPHGRAWRIIDKQLLMTDAVPKYFVQKKYESFTRQLSCWGFKRLHQPGPDFGCYYHECFLRGLPELTPLMHRNPTNPGGPGKPTPHAEDEPDLYEISQLYPVPLERKGQVPSRNRRTSSARSPDGKTMRSLARSDSSESSSSGSTSMLSAAWAASEPQHPFSSSLPDVQRDRAPVRDNVAYIMNMHGLPSAQDPRRGYAMDGQDARTDEFARLPMMRQSSSSSASYRPPANTMLDPRLRAEGSWNDPPLPTEAASATQPPSQQASDPSTGLPLLSCSSSGGTVPYRKLSNAATQCQRALLLRMGKSSAGIPPRR